MKLVDELRVKDFIFKLYTFEREEKKTRGWKDATDWRDYELVVSPAHILKNDKCIFGIWSMYDDYTIELEYIDKFFSFLEFNPVRIMSTFFVGMYHILQRNNIIRERFDWFRTPEQDKQEEIDREKEAEARFRKYTWNGKEVSKEEFCQLVNTKEITFEC